MKRTKKESAAPALAPAPLHATEFPSLQISHPLEAIFRDAVDQARKGKGDARHGNGRDFMSQTWLQTANAHGMAFLNGPGGEEAAREQRPAGGRAAQRAPGRARVHRHGDHQGRHRQRREGRALMGINILHRHRGLMDVVAHGVLVTRPFERVHRDGRWRYEPVIYPGEALYEAPDGEYLIGPYKPAEAA